MIVVLPAVLAAVVLLFLSPMTVKADNEESDIYGNRCYFNQATGILTLKGEVMNGGNYRPLILPDGVEETDVRKIDVDAEGATLPENSSYLFYDLKNVTEINLERADTSKVTDMRYMFYNCTSLQSLDLSGFVTRKVTNMQMMFRDCFSLQSLDLDGLDTSRVKNMQQMFSGCISLQSLNLSGFATGMVEKRSRLLGFHGF